MCFAHKTSKGRGGNFHHLGLPAVDFSPMLGSNFHIQMELVSTSGEFGLLANVMTEAEAMSLWCTAERIRVGLFHLLY